jgi:hypothetical protein
MFPVDGKFVLCCAVHQPNVDHRSFDEGSYSDLYGKGQQMEHNLGPSQQDVEG